jgi:SAM-dependent methyltransferase
MRRIVEPELMDEAGQAAAYAGADFEQPHQEFIAQFRAAFPAWDGRGRVLDLGCGPGDIAIRFARAFPECRVDGVDGAEAMLACGRKRLAGAEAADVAVRVTLHRARLPSDPAPADAYDAVISNSLLHHLHDPMVIWSCIRRYARPDAPWFVKDLRRPDSVEAARALADRYAAGEPAVLQRDFFHSLCAAFTADEVVAQVAAAGLVGRVESIGDRHLVVFMTRIRESGSMVDG